MKLKSSFVLKVMLISCNMNAMEKAPKTPPPIRPTLLRISNTMLTSEPVTSASLQEIMPTEECQPTGKISMLINRPAGEWFQKVDALELLLSGVQEDIVTKKDGADTLAAVTLIRADVSDALGDVRRSGDHIHVDGIDLSEKTLADGAVIVVKSNARADLIKALLLKTHLPYYADWQFSNRCGRLAKDFFNDHGQFHEGTAIRDRLRGVALAVLQAGIIEPGDCVEILSLQASDELIQKLGLRERAARLLELSKPIAQQKNEEFAQDSQDAKERPHEACPHKFIAYMGNALICMSFVLIFMGCNV